MRSSFTPNLVPFGATVYLMGKKICIKVKGVRAEVEFKTAADAWEAALQVCEMARLTEEVAWVRENPVHIFPSTPRRAAVAAIRRVAHAQELLSSVEKKAG